MKAIRIDGVDCDCECTPLTGCQGRCVLEDIDRFVHVNGESFRCDCGGNLFRKFKHQKLRYKCNSCGATYTGER
jgi:hypothetical protein